MTSVASMHSYPAATVERSTNSPWVDASAR